MKYAWFGRHDRQFDLNVLSQVLNVSLSGYRAWKGGGSPERKRLTDTQMPALICAIQVELTGAYGSPRRVQEQRARSFAACKARVERLMHEHGIGARHKRRCRVTTDSPHGLPVAPNQIWTSDITYLWTGEGWLSLAIVLDLFNREVVGWSLKPSMTADLVTDALTMAWFRRPGPGVVLHSDRGSQYASSTYQARLVAYDMIWSMSRKGNCSESEHCSDA